MPRANPARRDRLADAAIEVLADVGARGLTHRAVDAAAGAPEGTTSRYFRSRQALLQGVADRSLLSLAGMLRGSTCRIGRPSSCCPLPPER